MTAVRLPGRGEVWWAQMPSDPPEKGRRPVIIVSPNHRNRHPRSNTVLVIPLSTSILRIGPACLLLRAGETGLPADSVAQADNITVLRREWLSEPRPGQRAISHTKICQLAALVRVGMECS